MAKGTVTPEKIAQGKRLERLRLALGFRFKTAFAEWLEIGEDTYRHYAEGRVRIPSKILLLLKQRKGVPTDWILDGDPSQLPRWLDLALNQRDVGENPASLNPRLSFRARSCAASGRTEEFSDFMFDTSEKFSDTRQRQSGEEPNDTAHYLSRIRGALHRARRRQTHGRANP